MWVGGWCMKGSRMPTKKQIDKVLHEADSIIQAQVKKLGPLAGLAVGIVHRGELIYTHNTGFADIRTRRPITSDTIFRIMSISKTFTAVAVMQLYERGKLGLDDPVNDHLKAIKVEHPHLNAPPITIRHLLTHTAGIGELRTIKPRWLLRPETMILEDLSVREDDRVPTLAEYYRGKLRAEIYPGVKRSYSNHAFGLLGQLVADVSGQPFEDYITEHIFQPLGMLQSDWFLSDRVRERLATGYLFRDNGFKPVEDVYGYQHVVTAGASNSYSSVNEMVQYVAALMNGGANANGRILQPATLAQMVEPHFQLDPRLPGQGLAFLLDSIGSHRTVSHSGGWPGFISNMLVAPDDGLAVLVFTNTANRAPHPIAHDLLRRLLNVPDPLEQVPHPHVPEQPHLWEDLCGSYGPTAGANTNYRNWESMSAKVEVFAEGNHLTLRSPGGIFKAGVQLHPADADDPLFFEFVQDGSVLKLVFKRNSAGAVDRLQFGLNDFYKKPVLTQLPVARTLYQLEATVRRNGAALFGWYLRGMPNKFKIAGRILLGVATLWLLLRPRQK